MKNNDKKKFILGDTPTAIRSSPILFRALQELVQSHIVSFGIAEVSLTDFGLSPEAAQEVADKLGVEVSFSGQRALFSVQN